MAGTAVSLRDETSLTLYINLEQGTRIDLETAAQAALAFSRAVKAVAAHQLVEDDVAVELQDTLQGSQRINAIVRSIRERATPATIKGIVAGVATWFLIEAGAWTLGEMLSWLKGPDAPPEVQSLSDDALEEIAQAVLRAQAAGAGRSEIQEVFEVLSRDRHVTGVGVTSSRSGIPVAVVPRDRFPEAQEELDPVGEIRIRETTTDLILIRPVLTNDTNRRWGFRSAAGAFGAEIKDTDFLNGIATGTLNVPMVEGIQLRVRMEVAERSDGTLWRPEGRTIIKVLAVVPPAKQEALRFPPVQDDQPGDDDDGSDDKR